MPNSSTPSTLTEFLKKNIAVGALFILFSLCIILALFTYQAHIENRINQPFKEENNRFNKIDSSFELQEYNEFELGEASFLLPNSWKLVEHNLFGAGELVRLRDKSSLLQLTIQYRSNYDQIEGIIVTDQSRLVDLYTTRENLVEQIKIASFCEHQGSVWHDTSFRGKDPEQPNLYFLFQDEAEQHHYLVIIEKDVNETMTESSQATLSFLTPEDMEKIMQTIMCSMSLN